MRFPLDFFLFSSSIFFYLILAPLPNHLRRAQLDRVQPVITELLFSISSGRGEEKNENQRTSAPGAVR